jgi:hypothetical protein
MFSVMSTCRTLVSCRRTLPSSSCTRSGLLGNPKASQIVWRHLPSVKALPSLGLQEMDQSLLSNGVAWACTRHCFLEEIPYILPVVSEITIVNILLPSVFLILREILEKTLV